MRTVKKMDAGDICLTDKISIGENTTVPMLTEEISQKAPVLIHKTLTQIVAGQLEFIQQEENDVTFAPKFVKEDGLIDFSLTAEEIHNKVRGLQPWPNAYINRNGKNIQILETEVNRDIELTDKIGEIISISRDGVVVNCKNSAITIKTVKPESKGMMRASDFINGKRLKEGEIL
jgi:methionyl-tRNA formyltransferase